MKEWKTQERMYKPYDMADLAYIIRVSSGRSKGRGVEAIF